MWIPLAVYFLSGLITWLIIRVRQGEVLVADVILGSFIGIAGPLLPIMIGTYYSGKLLERLAMIVIWQRKKS